MKQLFVNRIRLISATLLFLVFFLFSQAGKVQNPNPFSGKVFVLAVGIDDYISARIKKSDFCESDANNFVKRIEHDRSFTQVQAVKILGKEATKENIKEELIGISKIAKSEDLFIFFNASLGRRGSILLVDSSTISSVELYLWSQSILTTRQLFYLDMCDGDDFAIQLNKYIIQNPDVSALCKQNRVILSVRGPEMESREIGGGLLTMAYVRNSRIKILDIFSESNRTQTKILFDLYNQNAKNTLGENHPDNVTDLINLAQLYKSMGRYEQAEPLMKEAMRIDKESLGENHPAYGRDLNNLALLYQDMGRYEQAEPLMKEAMRIDKESLGENHSSYSKANLEIEYFSEKAFYNSVVEKDNQNVVHIFGSDQILGGSHSIEKANKKGVALESEQSESENNENLIKKGETLCLIIGIKDYVFFSRLYNTINDAQEIKSILSDKYRTKIIYLENPTYDEFMSKLADIQKIYKFEEGSQFFFFTSAHGSKNQLGEGCLLLKDSRIDKDVLKDAMLLTSIKRFIGQLNCTNSLILMDICYSGTMFDDETCVKPAALPIPKTSIIYNEKLTPNSIAYRNFLNQKTRLFIGSSNDQEASDGTGKHSPFALVVINFLKENNLPVMDSYYLRESIEKNIMTADAVSIPQFCIYGGGKDDGRFLFIKK
jgi:tetratricopeptide (TPR) repeat protein